MEHKLVQETRQNVHVAIRLLYALSATHIKSAGRCFQLSGGRRREYVPRVI